MESISGFLDGFDIAKILPKIGNVISSVRFWMVLLMYAGPLVLLGFGLWYYLKPVKEPCSDKGFRIHPAMGSVDAWQFTQKLAGVTWTALGGVLTVLTVIFSLIYAGAGTMKMVTACVVWMGIQALLAVISYGFIYWMVYARFKGEKE